MSETSLGSDVETELIIIIIINSNVTTTTHCVVRPWNSHIV